ncbi:unnamed protein product [Amoebophrya sp. A120]|nr:unnamed protein product [Amoebophrya sp. A120]|eukprot:GSA120T00000956001.1
MFRSLVSWSTFSTTALLTCGGNSYIKVADAAATIFAKQEQQVLEQGPSFGDQHASIVADLAKLPYQEKEKICTAYIRREIFGEEQCGEDANVAKMMNNVRLPNDVFLSEAALDCIYYVKSFIEGRNISLWSMRLTIEDTPTGSARVARNPLVHYENIPRVAQMLVTAAQAGLTPDGNGWVGPVKREAGPGSYFVFHRVPADLKKPQPLPYDPPSRLFQDHPELLRQMHLQDKTSKKKKNKKNKTARGARPPAAQQDSARARRDQREQRLDAGAPHVLARTQPHPQAVTYPPSWDQQQHQQHLHHRPVQAPHLHLAQWPRYGLYPHYNPAAHQWPEFAYHPHQQAPLPGPTFLPQYPAAAAMGQPMHHPPAASPAATHGIVTGPWSAPASSSSSMPYPPAATHVGLGVQTATGDTTANSATQMTTTTPAGAAAKTSDQKLDELRLRLQQKQALHFLDKVVEEEATKAKARRKALEASRTHAEQDKATASTGDAVSTLSPDSAQPEVVQDQHSFLPRRTPLPLPKKRRMNPNPYVDVQNPYVDGAPAPTP